MFVALRMLRGEEFPLIGPILAGTIHLGPIWYWLLALLLKLTDQSWLGTLLLVALLGAAQFPLAYLLGKEMQSRRAGMLWAFGMLLPSWSTFESLLPLHYQLTASLVLACLLCALRYWRLPRRRYLVGLALTFVLAVHAHPTCVALVWVAAPLVIWARYTRRCSMADLSIAAFIAALPVVPYLVWNFIHGFADIHAGIGYLRGGIETGSLSRIPKLLWAAALGGSGYWASAMLGFPKIAATTLLAVIASIGAIGFIGAAIAALRNQRRAVLLPILYAASVILLTTSLIRDASPFYMTTPLHVLLVGIVAMGLDRIGESVVARATRLFAVGFAIVAFGACAAGFAEFQMIGGWPFSFFPLYDVTAAPVSTRPLLLVPAYAMSDSGRFLCAQSAPSVHGALARDLLYDYAIEMRFFCGRADVLIGGNNADRQHWLGLPKAMLENLHIQPSQYVGPMGILAARPISTEPAIAVPGTPIYPSYAPTETAAEQRQYRVSLKPGEHIAVSSMAFFVSDPNVTVTISGQRIEPQFSDRVTRVYACATCVGSAGTEAVIDLVSTDLRDVDVVAF